MTLLRLLPETGAPIVVEAETALVGREASCHIVLADPSVSRQHAIVRRMADQATVEDQGSANGTFLNSVKVTTAALKSGDSLRFGDVELGVELVGDGELGSVDDDDVVSGRTLFASSSASFSTTDEISVAAPRRETP